MNPSHSSELPHSSTFIKSKYLRKLSSENLDPATSKCIQQLDLPALGQTQHHHIISATIKQRVNDGAFAKWKTRILSLSTEQLEIYKNNAPNTPISTIYFCDQQVVLLGTEEIRLPNIGLKYKPSTSGTTSTSKKLIFKCCSNSCAQKWRECLEYALKFIPGSQNLLAQGKLPTRPSEQLQSDNSLLLALLNEGSCGRTLTHTEWLVGMVDQFHAPLLSWVLLFRPHEFSSMRHIMVRPSHRQLLVSNSNLPSFEAQISIPAPADVALETLLDVENYPTWNKFVKFSSIVEEVTNHSEYISTDVVYICLSPMWILPIWIQPRDICIRRVWLTTSSGSCLLMMKSIDHSACPERDGYIRAHMDIGGYTISKPIDTTANTCLLKGTLRMDPLGWVLNSGYYKQAYNEILLDSFLGIRRYLEEQIYAVLPFPSGCLTGTTCKSVGELRIRAQSAVNVGESMCIKDEVDSPRKCQQSGALTHEVLADSGNECWEKVPASNFLVRSHLYLANSRKQNSEESIMELVAVDLFHLPNGKVSNIAAKINRLPILSSGSSDTWLVVQFQVPGTKVYSLVLYFRMRDDCICTGEAPWSKLWQEFLDGDDEYRNTTFKLIPKVVDGGWMIKKAVGSNTPVILGKKIDLQYFQGESYLEVDCDIGSSQVATYVIELVKGQTKNFVIDMAVLLEGKTEEQLPERVLGCVRLSNVELDGAIELIL